MQVSNFTSQLLTESLLSSNTSVYIHLDANLVEMMKLGDTEIKVIMFDLKAIPELLTIKVCSMNKVNQKVYSVINTNINTLLSLPSNKK